MHERGDRFTVWLRIDRVRSSSDLSHVVAHPFLGGKPEFQTYRSLHHIVVKILRTDLRAHSSRHFFIKNSISLSNLAL